MRSKLVLAILGAVVVIGVIAAMATQHMSGMGNMSMSGNTSSSTGSNAPSSNSIMIQNYSFSPATNKVKVGSTVTWTNQDNVHHTVTIDNGSGPKSNELGMGSKYSYTFKTAGTFNYHCEIHPSMHGSVIVTN